MVKLLVFVGKNYISASKVDGGVTPVSFSGENYMSYNGVGELNNFKQCLMDDLGIRALTDVELDMFFLDCGAEKKHIDYLYNLCRDAAKVNVVSIEKILPLVALNLGLGKNETRVYTFGDLAWQVTSHAEDKTITVQEVETAGGEELTPEDFGLLYEFRTVMQSDVEEIARIKAECQAEIDRMKVDFKKEKQKNDQNLKTCSESRENTIEGLRAEIKELKKKLPPEPSEREKQVVEKIRKFRDSNKLQGKMYVRGEIPAEKLNQAMTNIENCMRYMEDPQSGLRKVFGFGASDTFICAECVKKNEVLTGLEIKSSDVLALYDGTKIKRGEEFHFTVDMGIVLFTIDKVVFVTCKQKDYQCISYNVGDHIKKCNSYVEYNSWYALKNKYVLEEDFEELLPLFESLQTLV